MCHCKNLVIYNASGDDVIDGGKGKNKLKGGKGSDVFKFHKKGVQIIKDFNPEEDKIDLPAGDMSTREYWSEYGYVQMSDKVIAFGFVKDTIIDDYRILIKSKQPIDFLDIEFI